MSRPTVLILVLVSLATSFACGRSGAASRLVSSTRDTDPGSIRSSGESTLELPAAPAAPSIVVPPDRAHVDLAVTVLGDGFAATADRTRGVIEAIVAAVREGEGCDAHWIDHAPPLSRGDGGEYRGEGRLRLDVTLTDLGDTAARATRLDGCVARVDTAQLGEEVFVRSSPPLVTLDDPGAHRGALLEQRLAPLRELAEATAAPPQYEANGVRCRSSGAVSIVERQLSGVRLAIDFSCDAAT